MSTQATKQCRWCRTVMDAEAGSCPACHRSQRWITGRIGPIANLIALATVVATFAQAVKAYRHNVDAGVAAKVSVEAKIAAEAARSETNVLLGRISGLEATAQASRHSATEALVQVRVIAERVERMEADRRRRIEDLQRQLEQDRGIYTALNAKLAAVSPTIEVEVPQEVPVERRGLKIFRVMGAHPSFSIETRSSVENRANPEYLNLEQQLREASAQLAKSETALLDALND